MLPNIDLRIANMVKALKEVILPALPREQRQARDQAMLIAGHLGMLGGQWQHALRFEQVSLDDLSVLVTNLLPVVDPRFRQTLQDGLAAAQACERDSVTALEQALIDLGKIVDAVILGGDEHVALPPAAHTEILAYSLRHARRERTWFQANHLDPDKAALASIPAMLAAGSQQQQSGGVRGV